MHIFRNKKTLPVSILAENLKMPQTKGGISWAWLNWTDVARRNKRTRVLVFDPNIWV